MTPPKRRRDRRHRWAVARTSDHDFIGLVVLSWHRWHWQASQAAERRSPTYSVYSAAQVDESWRVANEAADLRAQARRNRGN